MKKLRLVLALVLTLLVGQSVASPATLGYEVGRYTMGDGVLSAHWSSEVGAPLWYAPREFALPALSPAGLGDGGGFWQSRSTQVGFGLVGAGVVLTTADVQTRALRMDYLPRFRYHYDDYLQFAPAVAMVAMKALGVESESSWGRMTVAGGLSTGLMLSTVYVVKYGIGRLRPDGSTHNSFPSGHTAMAFTAASLLHKEYGWLSPWVSVASYTAATITGISRMLNNRHWLSDVVVGAGVGIVSTELGYLLTDKILRGRGRVRPVEQWEPVRVGRCPSFVSVGIQRNALLYDTERLERITRSGVGFTIEGAWFFNPQMGVGGAARVGRYADLVERGAVEGGRVDEPEALNNLALEGGLYLNHAIAPRLHLGAKMLAGVGRNHYLKNQIVDSEGNLLAVVEYDTGEHFTATVGASLRWVVADNLAVRAYADYNYVRTDYTITPTAGSLKTYSGYRHPLSFGVAVDAMLW